MSSQVKSRVRGAVWIQCGDVQLEWGPMGGVRGGVPWGSEALRGYSVGTCSWPGAPELPTMEGDEPRERRPESGGAPASSPPANHDSNGGAQQLHNSAVAKPSVHVAKPSRASVRMAVAAVARPSVRMLRWRTTPPASSAALAAAVPLGAALPRARHLVLFQRRIEHGTLAQLRSGASRDVSAALLKWSTGR
jgi:hypothetical protein